MKIKRIFLMLVFSLCISCTCPLISFATINSPETAETNVDARIDHIDYQYKVIDGALYRRLYNYTTSTPLSDWVLVN